MKKKKLKKRIKKLESDVKSLHRRWEMLVDHPTGRITQMEQRMDTLSNRISNLSVPTDINYKLDNINKRIDILQKRTETDYNSFGNDYVSEVCSNCIHTEAESEYCFGCYDPLHMKYTHFEPKEEPKCSNKENASEQNVTKPE